MPVSKLLKLPFGSYLIVRLDYRIICGDELEAKIMRIIEMYMDDERRLLYRAMLNDPQQTIDPNAETEVTKDVWVAISHRLFKNDLQDQDMSENTLKRALKSLIKKKFIKVRDTGLKRYEAPKYRIDTDAVQEQLDLLGKLGKTEYQKLMVSKIDGIKNSSHQNETPSDHQKLMVSSQSMVSKIDGNSRRITDSVEDTVEEDTYSAGEIDTSALGADVHTPALSQDEPYQPDLGYASQEEEANDNHSHGTEHRSTPSLPAPRMGAGAGIAHPSQHPATSGAQAGDGQDQGNAPEPARTAPTAVAPAELSTLTVASPQASAKLEPKPLTLRAHTDLAFIWLDAVRKEASHDPLASYVANGANKKWVADLIEACQNTANEVNEANVALAWLAMWNAGKWQNGKSWQDPGMLTIKAFCEHYGEYLDRGRAKLKPAQPKKPVADAPVNFTQLRLIAAKKQQAQQEVYHG